MSDNPSIHQKFFFFFHFVAFINIFWNFTFAGPPWTNSGGGGFFSYPFWHFYPIFSNSYFPFLPLSFSLKHSSDLPVFSPLLLFNLLVSVPHFRCFHHKSLILSTSLQTLSTLPFRGDSASQWWISVVVWALIATSMSPEVSATPTIIPSAPRPTRLRRTGCLVWDNVNDSWFWRVLLCCDRLSRHFDVSVQW